MMKLKNNYRYKTVSAFVLIGVCFAALLVSLVLNFTEIKAFLSLALNVLSPIIYAGVIMLVLTPVINFSENKLIQLFGDKKHSKKLAKFFSVVISYLLLALVVSLCVFIIVSQSITFYDFALNFADEYLPVLSGVVKNISESSEYFGEIILKLYDSFKKVVTQTLSSLPGMAGTVAAAFGDIVGLVSDIILAVIISVYAITRRAKLTALANKTNTALFSKKTALRISSVSSRLYRNMLWFFSARAYNLVAVGVVFYLVLFAMGLKFYSVISLTIAICSVVPFLGMLAGGCIGVIIVVATDTSMTGWFVLAFVIIFVLDYVFLQQKVTNKKMKVSLGATIFSVLVGYFLWGIIGALLALPVYKTVRDEISDWYLKKSAEKQRVSNSPSDKAEAEE